MYLTGFADEVSPDLDLQINATRELGWKFIETRNLYGKNLAYISEEEFEAVQEKLANSGIRFNCYGSAVANWAKSILDSPESSYEEMRLVLPRMEKLGIKMIRIMSFSVPKELKPTAYDLEDEVIKRVSHIVKMAEDAGVLCVHENCMNWGGLSFEHTLRLLDRIQSPALKLVLDTGNPVFNDDIRGEQPYATQSAWEFYKAVKEHIAYVHIKDGYLKDNKNVYTFAGEGKGEVFRIMEDLIRSGYDGGISMEPHLSSVFHEEGAPLDPKICHKVYVEYGQRFQKKMLELGAKNLS